MEPTSPKPAPPLLTAAELRVLAAIEDLLERGWAPTYGEILERIGWRSKGALHQYIERLRRHGLIEGRGRTLRVVR